MSDAFQVLQEEHESGDQNLDFNITMEDNNSSAKKVIDVDAKQQEKQTVKIPVDSLPDYSKTQKVGEQSYLSQAAHPKMCIIQLIFKAISITTFILTVFILDWLNSNKTFPFVIIVLSAAFDFWAVKNLTGRYLVKLRWWSEIQEDGTEKWRFESFEDGIPPNSIDSNFFWLSQFGSLAFWVIVAFLNFISLSFFYFTLSVINLVLVGGNFSGYYKCRGAHQKKMKATISRLGLKMISDAF